MDEREIRAALGRGDCLVAYDLAMRAAQDDPDDLGVRYLAVLALARAGATERAAEQLAALGIDGPPPPGTEPELAEDMGALRARLAKDLAFAASGPVLRHYATVAAERYEEIFRAVNRHYSCINAATMWRVAGAIDRSRELARIALGLVAGGTSDDEYWPNATAAEAGLLLGELDVAREALEQAAAAGADLAARATTRRQLEMVCALTGTDPSILAPLSLPRVVHFCGHMVKRPGEPGRFPAGDEQGIAREIAKVLDARDVGIGYGALACGADILVAEALLARGSELHVVLPCSKDDFVELSVLPGGEEWVPRFERCFTNATSIAYATESGYLGSSDLFAFGAHVAMGKAILRSSYLATDAEQVAVWDGRPATGPAGTAVDVERWRASGRRTNIISCPTGVDDFSLDAPVFPEPDEAYPPRQVRALLFADARGFSRLREHQVPKFVQEVLTPLAAVLNGFGDRVLYRNTWGDGLYVVFDDVSTAAECALRLQETMREIDREAAGLPADLALRVGAHAGPVFEGFDPVTETPAYFGVEVTRTARIEPGTPPGDVYVTEPFAALVALDGRVEVTAQYVGPVPAAKGFGTMPLHTLRRRSFLAGS